MRKHFLILMLMALLPLAGWAQTATIGEMALGIYTYGKANFPVPVVKDSQGAFLTPGTHYTVVPGAFTDPDCAPEHLIGDKATMKADGTTKYWRKVIGAEESAYEGQSQVAYFTVRKATLKVVYGDGDDLDRTFGDDATELDLDLFAVDEADENYDGLQFEQTFEDIRKGDGPTGYTTTDGNAGADKKVTFTNPWTADNYEITYVASLTIAPKEIGDLAEEGDEATITVEQEDVVYTGTSITPVYTIKDGDILLTQGTAPVLYANKEEYNEAKGTDLDAEGWADLDPALKIKTPATGDYYVAAVRDVDGSEAAAACGWDGENNVYKPLITFQGNYTGTTNPEAGFAVTPAPITVSLKDAIHKTYNNTDQSLVDPAADEPEKKDFADDEDAVITYAGIVGDDVAGAADIKALFTAPTITCEADAINANDYVLTLAGGNTGEATNYSFHNYIPGTLTIDPAELVIKANAVNKVLNEEDPEFTLDETLYAGVIVEGDVVKGVTFTREDAGTAEGEALGSYDIIPNVSAAKVYRNFGEDTQADVTANYAFNTEEEPTQLTIGKAAIVVTIKEAEKFYGESDPDYDCIVTGLLSGDDLGSITITRESAGTEAGELPGNYILSTTVSNPNPARYESVTVIPSYLVINKAQLTFTMPTKSVVKDNTVDALTKDGIVVEGIHNNVNVPEDLYELTFTAPEEGPTLAEGKITAENVTYEGGYTATLTEAAQACYEIIVDDPDTEEEIETDVFCTGKLIVNKGTQEVLALNCDDEDYDKIIEHAGETQNVTINFANRNGREFGTTAYGSWKAEYWASMVLPFDVTVGELSSKLGYAVVNVIDKDGYSTDKGNPVFKFKLTMKGGNGSTEVLKANRPFVIKLADDVTEEDVLFESKKIVAPTAEDVLEAGGGATFEGTYLTKTVTPSDNDCWFLLGDYEKWAFINGSADDTVWSWDIISTEGFIKTTVAAREATFIMEELDGSTTALKSISADSTNDVKAEGWYTINGIKLNTVPTQKGVYINNGKKVVVK